MSLILWKEIVPNVPALIFALPNAFLSLGGFSPFFSFSCTLLAYLLAFEVLYQQQLN